MTTNGSTLGYEFDNPTLEYPPNAWWEELLGIELTKSQQEIEPYFKGTEACVAQSDHSYAAETHVKIEDQKKLGDIPPIPESESESEPDSEFNLPAQVQRKRQRSSTSQATQMKTPAEKISALEDEIVTLESESTAIKEMTNVEPKAKRLELNRIAANISRRRKQLTDLQSQVHLTNLEQENAALKEENAALKELVASLQNAQQPTSVSVTIPETTLLFQYQSPSPKTSPVKKQEQTRTQYRPSPF